MIYTTRSCPKCCTTINVNFEKGHLPGTLGFGAVYVAAMFVGLDAILDGYIVFGSGAMIASTFAYAGVLLALWQGDLT